MDSVDIEVLRSAEAWRKGGHKVALGTIVKTWGSAPRPVGAMVAVRDDGQVVGSVSGGCVEDDLIDKVKAQARDVEQARAHHLRRDQRGSDALGPAVRRHAAARDGAAHRAERHPGAAAEQSGQQQLVRRQPRHGQRPRRRSSPGRWQDVLEFDGRVLSAVHGPRWRLVLIGAGQLTRYLAEMARMLDYHVVVIDPREEYAAGWDLAAVPIDRGMPDDVVRELQLDGHSALVALTHDPKLDDLALMEGAEVAPRSTSAPSARRRTTTRAASVCKEFDVSVDEIARLRGPVGLYIGSKTPPEIAVAILAEMTAVRHGVKRAELGGEARAALRSLGLRSQSRSLNIVGLLLAAGSATRFGSDKLQHALPHGVSIAVQSARHLKSEVARVVAVVRPGSDELAEALKSEGCEVVVCENAAEGMGASLACAARAAGDADGYLIALADMPFLRAHDHRRGARRARRRRAARRAVLSRAPRPPGGARARIFPANSLTLRGDEGAKRLLAAHEKQMVKIPVGDPGALRDIDRPEDLAPPLRI